MLEAIAHTDGERATPVSLLNWKQFNDHDAAETGEAGAFTSWLRERRAERCFCDRPISEWRHATAASQWTEPAAAAAAKAEAATWIDINLYR